MGAVTRWPRMSADKFIEWAMRQPEGQRYELVAGEVVPMSPEKADHVRAKYLVWSAFSHALKAAALAGCELFGDGISVRVDATTVYEPDCLVRCGPTLPDDAVEVTDPVILVEVVSPSSLSQDTGAKLADYFRLPSVRHYLILKTESRAVIVHGRGEDDRIETRILRSGSLHLAPPGIDVDIASFFPPA